MWLHGALRLMCGCMGPLLLGLDPAGLTFHGCPASQRLDKSDAVYVDVVHTNGCRNYLVWTVSAIGTTACGRWVQLGLQLDW